MGNNDVSLPSSTDTFLLPLSLLRTFNWALTMGGKVPVSEGLEHTELPDGTGEFLDAWLMLVEKMVNPSTVLDSPHSLPVKVPGVTPTTPQFSALRFLIVTQKVVCVCYVVSWLFDWHLRCLRSRSFCMGRHCK